MRYAQIRKTDIQNGPGIRVSIFVQGCHFHCKNCWNQSTWDFGKGFIFTKESLTTILELAEPDHIAGLSILGGEPLNPVHAFTILNICQTFKEKYPDKTIWLWTGYELDDIPNKEILNYLDVIVTGQFKEELKDLNLKYCGSSNQQVIYLKR